METGAEVGRGAEVGLVSGRPAVKFVKSLARQLKPSGDDP